MTFHAHVRTVFGSPLFKRKDESFVTSRVEVFSGWAVTGFASLPIGGDTRVVKGFPMRILFLKGQVEITMTNQASLRHDCLYVTFATGDVGLFTETEANQTCQGPKDKEPGSEIFGLDHDIPPRNLTTGFTS